MNLMTMLNSPNRSGPTGEPVTWTQRTLTGGGGIGSPYGIYYGNGYWVMVSRSGSIRYSTDPTNTVWSVPSSTPGSTNLRPIRYGGGTWVAGGDSGDIVTATDPTGTWTKNAATGISADIRGLEYGNGYFIAVTTSSGGNAYVYSAADPTAGWTLEATISTTGAFYNVTYNGTTWATCGSVAAKTVYNTAGIDPTAAWSSVASDPLSAKGYGIHWDGTYWCVSGLGKLATATTSGGTWTLNSNHSFAGSSYIMVCKYGAGSWVTGALDQKLETVVDPTGTWNVRTSNSGAGILDGHYANGLWVLTAQATDRYITAVPGV